MREQCGADVICIGQVLLDCVVKGWENLEDNERLKKVDSITLAPGGDAFNESVILSRLGHRVQTVCGLGKDLAGQILTSELDRNGVDTNAIVYDELAQTPIANLLVDRFGERRSINTPAHRLRFFHLDECKLNRATLVSLASLFRAPLYDRNTILACCRAAKHTGAILTADMKLFQEAPIYLDDIKEALSNLDYVFPNESEAELYTGRSTYHDMASVFQEYGVQNVVIKLGRNGCYVKTQDTEMQFPAYSVNTVDTTGAGDNFVAGFLSSLLRGRDLESALTFATGCAAVCVQAICATTGVLNTQQVEDFIHTHNLG